MPPSSPSSTEPPRELAYKDQVGDSTANQISVAPLIALLALYFWVLQRRWPLATTRDALSMGATWVVLSVLFEFGFGHYVEGDSWADLFQNYDVTLDPHSALDRRRPRDRSRRQQRDMAAERT